MFEKVVKSEVGWTFSLWRSPNLLTIKGLLETNVLTLDTVYFLDKKGHCAYERT